MTTTTCTVREDASSVVILRTKKTSVTVQIPKEYKYYSLSTEFSVSISEDSVLCSPCYHAQLAIVKKQRLTSYDSDLESLIDSLTSDQPTTGKESEYIKLLAASKTVSFNCTLALFPYANNWKKRESLDILDEKCHR